MLIMFKFMCRWVPKQAGVKTLVEVLKKDFTGPWPSWTRVPDDRRDRWFAAWKRKVTWRPVDEGQMRKNFEQVGSKRLSNFLTKARVKNKRPDWIGQADWQSLLEYWASPEFQSVSSRNKTNRASERGGALHTTGRVPHHEVVEQMVCLSKFIALSILLNEFI